MSDLNVLKQEEITTDYDNQNEDCSEKILENVVFVVPELDMDSKEPIVVSEITDPDGVHTIFIEISQEVADETNGSFTSAESLKQESNETNETDPLWIPDSLALNDAISKEETVPKKPEESNVSRNCSFKAKPCKFNKPKNNAENIDNNDLLWLLNFKLDGLIKNNALDEIQSPNCSYLDAKKADAGSKSQPRSPSDIQEELSARKSKPPFTYTELIECALHEKGPLTVSEIYQWISDTFPYFKAWDDRWKNSVRHNLSINPYFRKGSKAKQGSGHLWTVSQSAESARAWSVKRHKYQEFEAYTKKMKMEEKSENSRRSLRDEIDDAREAEMAAACIEDKENRVHHALERDVFLPSHPQNSAMEQSAGEILSGVKRNVAVEYIEPKQDFLNPVSKEDLMGECGFLSQIEVNLTAESTDHMEVVESDYVLEHFVDLGSQFPDANSQCPQLLYLVN